MKQNKVFKFKLLTIGTLFIILLLFISINILSSNLLSSMRIDFTSNKLYTLSSGSKKILNELQEPLNLKFYFSKNLAKDHPYLMGYATRVKDLLLQYKKESKGKISLQIIEPEPFTEEEDLAVNYGLQGVPVDGEGNELYFGLVGTNSTAGKEIISFFQTERESQLEYDITQLVYKLNIDKQNNVAVISSLPISGKTRSSDFMMQNLFDVPRPWALWQQMEGMFSLKELDLDLKEIPNDIQVLMLINPENLSEDTLRIIDDFVMEGGNVLAFIEPFSELNPNSNPIINLQPLLNSWGVSIPEDKALAIREAGLRIRYQNDGREYITNYPLWFDLDEKYLSKDDIITAQIEKLTLVSPGVINTLENATTKVTPLIRSGNDSMLVSGEDLLNYRDNPRDLLNNYTVEEYPQTIAARITGRIKSPYTDKQIDNANIVLMANADFLHDRFWVNIQEFLGNTIAVPTSANGSFVVSALENLTGSNSLISIRNRGDFSRPFSKINELQLASQAKFKEKEQQLIANIDITKKKLSSLDKEQNSEERKKEEDKFRQELIITRKDLREVQHLLQKEIKILETKIRFINTAILPIFITVLGLGFWYYQTHTRKKYYVKSKKR